MIRCFSPRSSRSHSRGGDDPRDDVEGKDLLDPLVVAVDGERDPHPEQGTLGGLLALEEFSVGEFFDPLQQDFGTGAGLALVIDQLVEEALRSRNCGNEVPRQELVVVIDSSGRP